MLEVILTTITIKYSMESYKLQNYKYAMGAEHFFDIKSGDYKQEEVSKYTTATKEKFNDYVIKLYLDSIRKNSENNEYKGKKIDYAQKYFLFALLMIPFFAFAIIVGKFTV